VAGTQAAGAPSWGGAAWAEWEHRRHRRRQRLHHLASSA